MSSLRSASKIHFVRLLNTVTGEEQPQEALSSPITVTIGADPGNESVVNVGNVGSKRKKRAVEEQGEEEQGTPQFAMKVSRG